MCYKQQLNPAFKSNNFDQTRIENTEWMLTNETVRYTWASVLHEQLLVVSFVHASAANRR